MTTTVTTTERPTDRGATDARTTRIGAGIGVASIVLVAAGFAIAAPTHATITSPRARSWPSTPAPAWPGR
ncbi:hypothetical protein [Blastococcus sp. PRF04-17]|uniref:hypothetical protein n=1 Tax=Blastococcus sp. PRF04-17 TaxID=2933797 RepID=UPI001FF58FDF|nr:hypothetical protein [Blastococcus sp. PRF04-17]UOY01934.1 hypothetical protein MVA48_00675 [Blastococcus sp. PRF04-17]